MISRTAKVSAAIQHVSSFDVYRVTHRSGAYRDVRALDTFDARRWAAINFAWKQNDMHARIVEISGVSPERRHTGLMFWLRRALPYNLWR